MGRRETELTARALASSSPHRRLLLRVFGGRRHPRWRPAPWRDELRRAKAELARAMRWVSPDAGDAQALQAYKGQGRRKDLVRAVLAPPWDRAAHLKYLIDGCCHWVDYLRARGITSDAQLKGDLLTYGIAQVQPSLADALHAIQPGLHLSEPAYRRRRAKLGRAVLANLLRPRCRDPDDFIKKLRRRSPHGRWPWRIIELQPFAVSSTASTRWARARRSPAS